MTLNANFEPYVAPKILKCVQKLKIYFNSGCSTTSIDLRWHKNLSETYFFTLKLLFKMKNLCIFLITWLQSCRFRPLIQTLFHAAKAFQSCDYAAC